MEKDALKNPARFGLGTALMGVADYLKDGHADGRSLQVFLSRHAPEVVADAVTNIDVAAAITQFEADTAGAAPVAVTGTGTAGAPTGGTSPCGSNRGLSHNPQAHSPVSSKCLLPSTFETYSKNSARGSKHRDLQGFRV